MGKSYFRNARTIILMFQLEDARVSDRSIKASHLFSFGQEGSPMPVNVLRKKGARMSLQEARDRVEKLKRLSKSSNPHEAALAALRLQSFDVNAARAPKEQPISSDGTTPLEESLSDNVVEILEEFPDEQYQEIGEIEVQQEPDQSKVNWDTLHFELIAHAQKKGADAIVKIQLKGTPDQKALSGIAVRYLSPQEIHEMEKGKRIEEDEKAI
ncbi:MAG: hypothetical protein R3351_07170, partial [Nitrospirales bacterium]|nr:hypothetical protein [Nitrospirales bacterium]